jgi:phosphomevalonate kinase
MTPSLARVAALAEAHGGGAKPSGAGGGDVALAFFDDEDRAEAFRGACRLERLALVPLAIGVEGVRVEAPAEEHSGSREG